MREVKDEYPLTLQQIAPFMKYTHLSNNFRRDTAVPDRSPLSSDIILSEVVAVKGT
jgi:hypothetical protein